jgi:hypothetical protein
VNQWALTTTMTLFQQRQQRLQQEREQVGHPSRWA